MKQLKKLSLTLALLITAAAGAWADDTETTVTTNEAKTTASFTMPASDVTVNYTLVRDLEDQTNKVTFSGLPTTGNIIVKKGDGGKYQPAEALTIQLNDALISDDKNIIAADGLTVTVEKKGDGDTWTSGTLADFLADMQPGTYKLKATHKDENSPYEGTVTSTEFTVVEQYDLTVKPADDYSKGKVESVTVGSESVTIDANGEATKTGIAPNTNVKIKARPGYIIEEVKVNKAATIPVTAITLNKTATTIYKVNGTATETLSVTAVTPDEATDKTYTWSSDATGVATVDADGKVTAVAAGTAHIRATANDGSGVYGECTVTVSDLSAYYSKMVECGCDDLDGKCANAANPMSPFTGQVLSAAQAIALAQAKAADTGSNCAVFYDSGNFAEIRFAKNDGTTGSAIFYESASKKGLSGYRGFYVSK